MQVDEIRRLVKLVEESEIDELEVRRWWQVVRIIKRGYGHKSEVAAPQVVVTAPAVAAPVATPVAPVSPPGPPESSAGAPPAAVPLRAAAAATEEGLVAIRSPMVGTFYRAPNPTSPPFAEAGGSIGVGQVVCIVEAMKLMNEIESEVAGTVEKVLVENGKPVEFNQPLFLIRPE